MVEEREAQYAKDEDLERAKALWKENGRSIVAGIVIGLSAIGGFNFWQSYQQSQGENASELFEQLRNSATTGAAPEDIAETLFADYSSTPYASHAALYMAKNSVDANDLTAAEGYLQKVLDGSNDLGLQHVARTRLASVLNASGKAQQALDLLQIADEGSFAARYDELRGDSYAQIGSADEARKAYEKSLETVNASIRELIQLKLDSLPQGN